jgi:hypothetical protein
LNAYNRLMNWLYLLTMAFAQISYSYELPSVSTQKNIFKDIRNEMIRLDGEGLIAREDRHRSFKKTTQKILKNYHFKNEIDFFHLFKQMDATYTNLHSKVVFPEVFEEQIPNLSYLKPSFWSTAEVTSNSKTKLFVEFIEEENLKNIISEGDEIIAINGRTIESWLQENFQFCKHPLKIQCDRNFENNLFSYNLSFKGSELIYSIKHDNQITNVKQSFSEYPPSEPNHARKFCDYKADKRYPNFNLKYKGQHACFFEHQNNSKIGLLRINTFQYFRNHLPNAKFKTLEEEVNSFYEFWRDHSHQYKDLIIDLIDNHGGNSPLPYYGLFLHTPFQEQFVRFKKTKEIEKEELRNSIIWDDPAQILLFEKWFQNGYWDSLKYGEFTKPVPMFCSDESKPCDETYFQPFEHQFNGEIKVMLNEWCVSSCDGFVWAMKKKLNAKLYGFPQAADSAYGRLRIDAIKDSRTKKGYKIKINSARAELDPDFIVGQIVAVTRATDEKGSVFNGKPLELEKLVSYKYGEFYPKKVLKEILNDIEQKN